MTRGLCRQLFDSKKGNGWNFVTGNLAAHTQRRRSVLLGEKQWRTQTQIVALGPNTLNGTIGAPLDEVEFPAGGMINTQVL